MQPDETPHSENRVDWPLPPDLIEAIQRIDQATAQPTAGEPGASSTADSHEDEPAEPRFARPPDVPRRRRFRKSVVGSVALGIAAVTIWAVDMRPSEKPDGENEVGLASDQDSSQPEPERAISFLDWAAETAPEAEDSPLTTRRWRVRASAHAANQAAPSTSSAGDQHRTEPQPAGLMRRLLDEAFHELGW